MSISILNRGGISGGLKPELTVTAPSGSTIDLLQNGIIVATYTLGASETEHTFMVKVGTYTVRGTLDTYAKEAEVVIDVVGQYSVEIAYKLYLYNEGDQCEEVTGGWFNNTGSNMWGYSASGGTVTFGESMYLYAASNKAAIATTNNKVLINGYSKIVAVFGSMTDVDPRIMLTSEKTGQINSLAKSWFNPKGANTTTEKSIGDLAENEYYFSFGLASNRFANMKQLWLE